MNKLEANYAQYLQMQKAVGDLHDYKFEAIKLKLAERTTYSPDFLVITKDGSVELHEVKGFWEDDARVKIKVAASLFPYFVFRGVTRSKGQWVKEGF
jgi:hypothetical protein